MATKQFHSPGANAKLYALLCAVACLVADLQGVLVPSAVKVRRSDEDFVPRYPKVCDMPVSLRFCGILIVCSSGLSCGRCRHVQHLREVQGFRSAVLELANLLFSFRDSDSPTAPTEGAHGGAQHATDVRRTPLSCSLLSPLFSLPSLLSPLSSTPLYSPTLRSNNNLALPLHRCCSCSSQAWARRRRRAGRRRRLRRRAAAGPHSETSLPPRRR